MMLGPDRRAGSRRTVYADAVIGRRCHHGAHGAPSQDEELHQRARGFVPGWYLRLRHERWPVRVGQTCTSGIWMSAARYPPQLFTSTPSPLIPAMMRSGTT